MKISSSGLLNVILTIMLATSMLFMIVRSASLPPYDPWADIDDDGMIDVKDILHVALLYGATGTPIDKAVLTYDSGWINITDKKGQFFEVTHNLGLAGSTQFTANISGRASLSGQNHQRFFDGTGRRLAWNQTYGGIYYDFGYAVVETGDGGYALAGHTHSYGVGTPTYTNVYLVRTDADGNMLWNQTYGGIDDDFGYALVQTSDGGYAVAGFTYSYGAGNSDFYLVRTDADGNMLWNKTYGYAGSDEMLRSIINTADGGFALAGALDDPPSADNDDFFLVKTDENGNEQWNKTYGGSDWEFAHSVIQTSDGGYALVGPTRSFGAGNDDVWLIKTDENGNEQWNQTYGGTGDDTGSSVVETSDGGYAIVGNTYSYGLGGDVYLVSTDADGNMLWNQTYGGQYDDWGWSVDQTGDGDFAIAGYTSSYGAGGSDVYLVRTDADGNMLWNQTYGGIDDDFGYALVQTSDGGYTIAGWTRSFGVAAPPYTNVYLVTTDPFGELVGYSDMGLVVTDYTADTIALYRGANDPYWNYIRVYIWVVN